MYVILPYYDTVHDKVMLNNSIIIFYKLQMNTLDVPNIL